MRHTPLKQAAVSLFALCLMLATGWMLEYHRVHRVKHHADAVLVRELKELEDRVTLELTREIEHERARSTKERRGLQAEYAKACADLDRQRVELQQAWIKRELTSR